MRKIFIIIFALLLLATGCISSTGKQSQTPAKQGQPASSTASDNVPTATSTSSSPPPGLAWPISNALARVTKKPFGIYVTPQNSPISPEKFTGFHTGTDFETTATEQNTDVPIYAICNGKLLLKKYASGYGGVAVQECAINGQLVTVIYGHLRLASISPTVGQSLTAGQQIAVLGTGYSTETDGERKHLHLGIHKGTGINILGYVQNKAELSAFLDPLTILQ